jgi:N-methylhydantoinase A
LIEAGEKELAEHQSVSPKHVYVASLDMRYSGQSFELSVPCATDVTDMQTIERKFEEVYAARYGATTAAAIVIVSYRVAIWAMTEKPTLTLPLSGSGSIKDATSGTAPVTFGGKVHDVPIINRDLLPQEVRFMGPALVEEDGSSTVVPPGWSAEVDRFGCLVLRRI